MSRRLAARWSPLIAVTLISVALAACSSPTSAGLHPAAARSTAYAPPVAQVRGEPDYLALGDSIAFGYRPAPWADYRDAADFAAYPEDLAAALKLNLVNAACPGETSASMINPAAPSNGCETNARGGPGRLQQRQERPGQEERRLEVQVQDLVPGRGGKLGQRRAPRGACVVDQDVDPLLGPADLFGQPQAFLLAGQVGGHRQRHAVLGQLGHRGLPGLGPARADVHRSPGLQQSPRHHQADPAAAAADHGHLPGQVEQVHKVLQSGAQSRSP
jgi:hypothetical protein